MREVQEQQVGRIKDLEAQIDFITRISGLQMAAIEAGGGWHKLRKAAEKLGYLKTTHDAVATTDEFEEKITLVTPADAGVGAKHEAKKRSTKHKKKPTA